MASLPSSIPIKELTKEITLTVNISGYRGWLLRLWIAKKLFIFASWIIQTQIEFIE